MTWAASPKPPCSISRLAPLVSVEALLLLVELVRLLGVKTDSFKDLNSFRKLGRPEVVVASGSNAADSPIDR